MNDRMRTPEEAAASKAAEATPRQRMRKLRKHLLPLQSESMTPIDLPPVRSGLLAKLNVLTVGLIALTGLLISAYYFWQQWASEERELRQRGRAVASVLTQLAEFGLYTSDRTAVEEVLNGLANDRDVAYALVLDRDMAKVVERRFAKALGDHPIPPLPAAAPAPGAGQMLELETTIGD